MRLNPLNNKNFSTDNNDDCSKNKSMITRQSNYWLQWINKRFSMKDQTETDCKNGYIIEEGWSCIQFAKKRHLPKYADNLGRK